jgi:hypothetical protein
MGAMPASYYIGVEPEAMKSLPEPLQRELREAGDAVLRHELGGDHPCIWLDMETRRCKHYEFRPDVCVEAVLPGDDACRSDRRRFGIDPSTHYSMKGGKLVQS